MEHEKDSDHNLLIRIDERLKAIEKSLTNHLRHHWAVEMILLAAVLGLIAKIMWL